MAQAQYVVVNTCGQWMIAHEGKHYGPYETQEQALRGAIKAAQSSGKRGHEAEVLLQALDNTTGLEWTYGSDPYPAD